MEIFGIPVFFIFILVIWVWAKHTEQQQKNKEELAKKWDAITIGMSKEDVFGRLGKPNRIAEVGEQEAWGYGPDNSDGLIMFFGGQVVDFQKPSCTLNVSDGQSSGTDTDNPIGKQPTDTDTADVSDGQTSKTNIMSTSMEFFAPNGLHNLHKTIISHFLSLGYKIKLKQPLVLVFTRGSQWSFLYRSDIRTYYTDLTVRIGNETEQGTLIRFDFEIFTWRAIVTKGDAAVLETEVSSLKSKVKSGT